MNPLRIFLLAGLLFFVFGMNDVEAGDGDLDVTLTGDDEHTTYGPKYGNALFTGTVSSNSPDSDDDLTVSVTFSESDWDSDQASIGYWDDEECAVNDGDDYGTGSYDFGTLDGILEYCISVSIGDEADNGDSSEMTISVSSSSSTAYDINSQIVVSDWAAISPPENQLKDFDVDETNTYTITLQNRKINGDGTPVAFNQEVRITPSILQGWIMDSDDSGWDSMEKEYTLGYIDAGASYDFVFTITATDILPASSYLGYNYDLPFQISDDYGVLLFKNIEAIVNDHFSVSIQGSGNHVVDNGCINEDITVSWAISIKNFGNLQDSFDVTFDTSDAVAAAWTVTGADDENTGDVLPKFEQGTFTLNFDITVPGGLPAGTTHGITMTATSEGDSTETQTQEFSATILQCYGISMAVDKTTDSADPGVSSDFTVTVTNTGNGEDTVSYMTMGAQTWTPTLSEMSSTIASGADAQVVFTLTVPSDASSEASSGMAMVHAYSEGCGEDTTDCDYEAHTSVQLSSNQVFDISAGYYYNASMASASVQEGMALQLKFNVTNNGNGNDNVGVALANAQSWITLSQDTVLLGPGQTGTVTIDISAPASGTLGAVDAFQIVATSYDGETTSTTGDFTVTVVERSTGGSGPTTEVVLGCIDPEAKNYNQTAEQDDGTCEYYIEGCMNLTAVNFLPEAEIDDNSCKFAPIAIAGEMIQVEVGSTVQFNGAATDKDGNIVKYEWDFNGDGIYEWSSEENGRTTNIYNTAGTYVATLKVTDNDGNTALDSFTVTVKVAKDDSGESGLPSISIISAVSMFGLIAIFRRK